MLAGVPYPRCAQARIRLILFDNDHIKQLGSSKNPRRRLISPVFHCLGIFHLPYDDVDFKKFRSRISSVNFPFPGILKILKTSIKPLRPKSLHISNPRSMSQPVVAVGIVGLQLITTSLVVGFARRESPLRLGGIPVMLLAAYSQLSQPRVHHPIARPFLGAASVFLVILYIDAALLSRWTIESNSPTSPLGGLDPRLHDPDQNENVNTSTSTKSTSKQSGRLSARLAFGFNIALQSRFPCTVWAAKNIPDFPQSIVPSRASFLIRNILRCSSYVLLLRLVHSLGDSSQNGTLFSSTKIPLAGNIIHPRTSPSTYIDVAQLSARLLGVLGYWTVQYLIINLLYDILATLSVTFHITNVDVWPPVFGRLNEAWSLRQFWG